MKEITADTKVNEIMKMYPELTDLLMDLDLCGCGHDSSLTWTVKRISQEKGIELNSLLKELNADTGSNPVGNSKRFSKKI